MGAQKPRARAVSRAQPQPGRPQRSGAVCDGARCQWTRAEWHDLIECSAGAPSPSALQQHDRAGVRGGGVGRNRLGGGGVPGKGDDDGGGDSSEVARWRGGGGEG